MFHQTTFKIIGMHCTSCSINIDGELEEIEGVHSSSTSYAKQQTIVKYDTSKVTPQKIITIIKSVGYEAVAGG